MGKTNAFARAVLFAGPPEQFKYPLVVAGVDAAPIVLDIIDCLAGVDAAADLDLEGNVSAAVFQSIINEIGENLLQRQRIARRPAALINRPDGRRVPPPDG